MSRLPENGCARRVGVRSLQIRAKAISKSLAAAESGEVGLFMHHAGKVLVVRVSGEDEKAAVIFSEPVPRGAGVVRSYLVDEASLETYNSVIFFPDAVIVPDVSSLHYSYDTEALAIFYVDREAYMLVPDDVTGWGRRYRYFNFHSASFVKNLPDTSNGRWYFGSWKVVLGGEKPEFETPIFSLNAVAS